MLSVFSPDLLLAPRRILEGIELLGDAAITVHYEYFVQQPEESTEQLCRQLGVSYEPGMIEYDDTPAAKGFMTDRIGIQQHSRPTPDSIDKWKRMLGNRQELHFAQSYLEALGREIIEKMGYPYDELSNAIRVADRQSNGDGPVFPWDSPGAPGGWTATVQADGSSVQVNWNAPTSDGGTPILGYTVEAISGTATGRLAALADLFAAGIRWLKFTLRRT